MRRTKLQRCSASCPDLAIFTKAISRPAFFGWFSEYQSILLGLATAGVGLLFPIACWAALAADAYCERDLRKHHWFLPSSDGRDEDDAVD